MRVPGSRAMLSVAALLCAACIAGPQPEPPERPHDAGIFGPGMDPHDASRGNVGDAAESPPPDPVDASGPAADAGVPGVHEGPPPWIDPDDATDWGGDDVAPFPFEPCCGWFALPGEADAGTSDDASTPDASTTDDAGAGDEDAGSAEDG